MREILIAFAFGLASYLAGYYLGRRRARGMLRQAEEYANWAGEALEEAMRLLEEIKHEQQTEGR